MPRSRSRSGSTRTPPRPTSTRAPTRELGSRREAGRSSTARASAASRTRTPTARPRARTRTPGGRRPPTRPASASRSSSPRGTRTHPPARGSRSSCRRSPTSTSMVVAYWGRGPAPADYAYVLQDYPSVVDPWVDFAAARTYDYHYQGAGNWPFNTAYASTFGLDAEVTQLRSLNEAELFV